MPLFIIRAHAGMACTFDTELAIDEIHVHAKDENRARMVAAQDLMDHKRYDEMSVFADPDMSTIERVVTRAPEGVVRSYDHHCEDHS